VIWLVDELRHAKDYVLDLEELWLRYKDYAEETGTEIPQSFHSRRTTFKDKLSTLVKGDYEFIVVRDQAPTQTLLIYMSNLVMCHSPNGYRSKLQI